MQPRSSFDRALLIPVVISIFSILGICWIFWTSGLGKKILPPTAIPSSFSPLQAVTPTPSPAATSTQDEPATATATSPVAYPAPPSETPSVTSTVIAESLPSPTATFTPENIQPLQAGKKYDDTDPNIAYDPYWTALKNPSTASSYQGTIHASTNIGTEASFRFTGKRFRLGYKRGKTFGTVTVIIDDQSYSFDEQAFDLLWNSPQLSAGDHFVRIIHESGESINLDYIVILD